MSTKNYLYNDVQKCIFSGKVDSMVNLRMTQYNDAMLTLTLESVKQWLNADNKLQVLKRWHRIVFYRALAEQAASCLTKNDKIFIIAEPDEYRFTKNGKPEKVRQYIVNYFERI